MVWMFLAFAVYAAAIVWMYAKGNNGKAWLAQGIRFGIAVWAVASVPMYLINYDVSPWPGMIVAKQLGWDFIAALLLGVITAGLSRSDIASGFQARKASA